MFFKKRKNLLRDDSPFKRFFMRLRKLCVKVCQYKLDTFHLTVSSERTMVVIYH